MHRKKALRNGGHGILVMGTISREMYAKMRRTFNLPKMHHCFAFSRGTPNKA